MVSRARRGGMKAKRLKKGIFSARYVGAQKHREYSTATKRAKIMGEKFDVKDIGGINRRFQKWIKRKTGKGIKAIRSGAAFDLTKIGDGIADVLDLELWYRCILRVWILWEKTFDDLEVLGVNVGDMQGSYFTLSEANDYFMEYDAEIAPQILSSGEKHYDLYRGDRMIYDCENTFYSSNYKPSSSEAYENIMSMIDEMTTLRSSVFSMVILETVFTSRLKNKPDVS